MSIEQSTARVKLGSRPLFDPDQLYSVEQVRDKLGGKLHIMTVWKWSKTGVLPPALKIGPNTCRWRGAALNSHIAARLETAG